MNKITVKVSFVSLKLHVVYMYTFKRAITIVILKVII
jgi:hypothetical protein